MSDLETAQYYVEAHRRALARDQDDRLEAVIASGEDRWVIRFRNLCCGACFAQCVVLLVKYCPTDV